MKLIYNTDATPKQMGYGQTLLFALQQLLAILAATILVPMIVNPAEMTVSAALFGAGVGTLVYQLFTKFRSPVFLGSSFAFLGSMTAAFTPFFWPSARSVTFRTKTRAGRWSF